MSTNRASAFAQEFSDQLRSTRDRIALLPDDERAYFQSLADEVERTHYQMQEKGAMVRSLVDDLRLREAKAKLQLWIGALKTLQEETAQ
jgi:hypothetical protein